MCTAITYQTKQLYFGRTLDYECSYGEQVTITPRNYPFDFHHAGPVHTHYAIIGMAHVAGGTTDAAVEKHVPVWTVENGIVHVKVGSVEHPMLPEHYIERVSLHTKQGNQRK